MCPMPDRMITTFPTRAGFDAARQALDAAGLTYELLPLSEGMDWLAAPGLIMTTEVRGALAEAAGDGVSFSGWVDYRPMEGEPERGVVAELETDIFGRAAVTVLTPCVADERKIRIIAELKGDLGPVFPYLNSVIPGACYAREAETLTYIDGHRMIVLYPRRIAMAKPDNLVDAWLRLEGIRSLANATWARRDAMTPSYVMRKKPPALEILRRLPGTNCGLCGEMTCMAFALRLWGGEARLEDCTPVFVPEQAAHLAALNEICRGLGVSH